MNTAINLSIKVKQHLSTIIIALAATTMLAFASCKDTTAKHAPTQHENNDTAKAEAKTIPDIELPDFDRNNISLLTEAAKHTLTILDFWAIWCEPCRAEIPGLVSLYRKEKNKGLGIVGISLDSDYHAWRQAVSDNKMTWTHMCDLRGWDSYAVQTYGISSIPQTFVIDSKGALLATGLRGKELAQFVTERLDKTKRK